ncbi:hypothetical protein BDW60DRAFT_200674 [Aspergillus nidulans var. acristatus]
MSECRQSGQSRQMSTRFLIILNWGSKPRTVRVMLLAHALWTTSVTVSTRCWYFSGTRPRVGAEESISMTLLSIMIPNPI